MAIPTKRAKRRAQRARRRAHQHAPQAERTHHERAACLPPPG